MKKKYIQLLLNFLVIILLADTSSCAQEHEQINAQQEQIEHPLHDAVKEGNAVDVAFLLAQGANVNERDTYQRTALHVAAMEGDVQIATELVRKGALVDARDRDKSTPLHLACKKKSVAIVELLLFIEADVIAQDKSNDTPLHNACESKSLQVVELLVQKLLEQNRAFLNMKNTRNETPLHRASLFNNNDIVSCLLANNAETHHIDGQGLAPYSHAARHGNVHMVEMFAQRIGGTILWPIESGQTILHHACNFSRCSTEFATLSTVDYLVQLGADINAKDHFNITPLHVASQNGPVQVVRYLALNSADVDAQAALDRPGRWSISAGYTPLHFAAREGHLKIVRCLLAFLPDVNAKNGKQETPLHLATIRGHRALVKELLKHGANINARDINQQTPLHAALLGGHSVVEYLLVQEDIDVDATDTQGHTPLSMALHHIEQISAAVRHGVSAINGYLFGLHPCQMKEVHPQWGETPESYASRHIAFRKTIIKSLITFGVYYTKADKRLLEKIVPEYTEWIQQEKDRLLIFDLAVTYVEVLPKDLQKLILEFVISQTEKKRKREGIAFLDTKRNKKHKD